jgi:hypothetical protein
MANPHFYFGRLPELFVFTQFRANRVRSPRASLIAASQYAFGLYGIRFERCLRDRLATLLPKRRLIARLPHSHLSCRIEINSYSSRFFRGRI